jgi:hypothetical protein
MNGPRRRFDPAELVGDADARPSEAELAAAYGAARVLEAHATMDRIGPTDGFENRVMAAIATEPAPRLALHAGAAFGRGRSAGFVVALRDAWGIATGRGRPVAVRAQALGFLVVVIVAAGSLGTVTAVGVGSLLQPGPTPTAVPAPTVSPDVPSPSPVPTTGPSPSVATETPSASPGATETVEPSGGPDATPPGTDDHGGGGSATSTPDPSETAEPADTPKPDATLKPGETLKSGETPRTTDDHGGGSGNG